MHGHFTAYEKTSLTNVALFDLTVCCGKQAIELNGQYRNLGLIDNYEQRGPRLFPNFCLGCFDLDPRGALPRDNFSLTNTSSDIKISVPIRSTCTLTALSLFVLICGCASTFAAVTRASADSLYQLCKAVPAVPGQNSVLEPLMGGQPFTANIERIKSILLQAPPPGVVLANGGTQRQVEISLPMPEEGKYLRFAVEEVAIMHPDLAAKYPEIKTYRGHGLDDPSARLALDFTPAGMHAQIRNGNGAIYIDPCYRGNDRIYVSYHKRDIFRNPKAEGFVCLTPGRATRASKVRRPLRVQVRSYAPIAWPAPQTARLQISLVTL